MVPQKTIRLIIDRLKNAGHQVYVTGGAVRDMMLNRPPSDVDILTCAPLDEVVGLFAGQKVKRVGKTFPIVLVDDVEISTGRHGADPEQFPESDLAARDFTLNALAFDPFSKRIFDPFNGRKDMEEGIIRFTREPAQRIKEDPVRMIRACRFAALIRGDLSLSSFEAILSFRHLIESAAKERIRHEIMRAMQLESPSLFFTALAKTGLLETIFPSLERCRELDGGPFHGETVFEHCMLVGDALKGTSPLLRLAGFLHDVGKFDAAVIKEGRLTFAGHEKHTAALVRDLKNLRFSTREIRYIESITRAHMRPLTDSSTNRAVRRLLAMLDGYGLDYHDFLRMRIADKKGNLAKHPYTFADIRARLARIKQVLHGQPALTLNHLALSGSDIIRIMGVDPGPSVGKIKQALLDYVLDHPEMNTFSQLEKKCRTLKIDG